MRRANCDEGLFSKLFCYFFFFSVIGSSRSVLTGQEFGKLSPRRFFESENARGRNKLNRFWDFDFGEGENSWWVKMPTQIYANAIGDPKTTPKLLRKQISKWHR